MLLCSELSVLEKFVANSSPVFFPCATSSLNRTFLEFISITHNLFFVDESEKSQTVNMPALCSSFPAFFKVQRHHDQQKLLLLLQAQEQLARNFQCWFQQYHYGYHGKKR